MRPILFLSLSVIFLSLLAIVTVTPTPTTAEIKTENTERPADKPVATFAGGCFWCIESEVKDFPGVIFTRVGYTGGANDNPSYNQITTGKTGHAEAVQIYYDPDITNYRALLEYFLTKAHDPTQLNRQWVDVGTQYRSAIFYHDEIQKAEAEAYIAKLTEQKRFKKPIVTEVVPAETFWDAEEYHQNYYEKYEEKYGVKHRRLFLKPKR